MSRSNYDKPFYVDVGTSIVAIRCASNHDVVIQYDYVWGRDTLNLAKNICDRMNREAEISRPRRNCDVGTVEEQTARMRANCAKRKPACKDDSGNLCKCYGDIYKENCFLKWAQMPYEEGGAK